MEGIATAPQKLNRLFHGILVFLASVFLLACSIEPGYEETTSFGEIGWPEKQVIQYKTPPIEATGKYDLEIFLRHDNNYPFYNCYFIAEIKNEKGLVLKKGLAEAIFYDPQSGKPRGEGLGDIFSHQYKIFENLTVKKGEKINIELRQYMRRDTLQGIVSVGFALKPHAINGKN